MVEPDDARALETAMANYLDDPDLAKLAKARAKTLKNQFSVEVMARDIEAAYLASL
jgi:glycosyltransferase involved in cell wall biosynthesis